MCAVVVAFESTHRDQLILFAVVVAFELTHCDQLLLFDAIRLI